MNLIFRMGSLLRSLNDYFRRLNDLLSSESWESSEEAAKLLSIGDVHIHLKFLQVNFQILHVSNVPLTERQQSLHEFIIYFAITNGILLKECSK